MGTDTNSQVLRETRASMPCFQADTNIASSYELGIEIEDKERADWQKKELRRSYKTKLK